jgi:hypothetical protein
MELQSIEGTKEAFLTLINQKGFAKKYGYGKSAVSCWKMYVRENTLSLDKMEAVLTNCGAIKVKDANWQLTEQETTE